MMAILNKILSIAEGWFFSRCLRKNIFFASDQARCYLIGLGPSLKKVKLDKLGQGDIFFVNAALSDDRLIKLKHRAAFWIIWDDVVETFTKSKLRRLKHFSDIVDDNTSMVFPSRGRYRIQKYGLFNKNKKIYLREMSFRSELAGCGSSLESNAIIARPDNSIEIAIILAVKMKYSEIVLVGCDSDFFNYDEPIYKRSYSSVILEEDPIIESGDLPFDMSSREAKLCWSCKVYRKYRYLNELAQSRGIKIIDATIDGKLDMFEKKPITEYYDPI